jgi:hypothetical protein
MSKVFKAKEESHKVSFALKKATAEEALKTGKVPFSSIKRSSNSSNRSYFSSSCTADSNNTAAATTSANTTE